MAPPVPPNAILAALELLNDSLAVAGALAPLIQQQLTGGPPVTVEDMKIALAGKDAALKRFDDLIAQKGA